MRSRKVGNAATGTIKLIDRLCLIGPIGFLWADGHGLCREITKNNSLPCFLTSNFLGHIITSRDQFNLIRTCRSIVIIASLH